MNKKQIGIYDILNTLFIQKGYWETGTFVSGYDVQLTNILEQRTSIAYISKAQLAEAAQGQDPIPAFMIEIISDNDNINKVEEKINEYYKAGANVVWLILPENKSVHVYTSRRDVKICIENDICSAAPVLPELEIGVDVLLG